jgi:hypothetical protein
MNKKQFLINFMAVIFASALVLGGCPAAAESVPVPNTNIAFQNTVDGINFAFSSEYPNPIVSTVYLTNDVELGNQTLIIPPGKTLNLNGHTINKIEASGTIVNAGYMDFPEISQPKSLIDMSVSGQLIANDNFIKEQAGPTVDGTTKHIILKADSSNAIPIGVISADSTVIAFYSDNMPASIDPAIYELYIIGDYTFTEAIGIKKITVIGNAIISYNGYLESSSSFNIVGKVSNSSASTSELTIDRDLTAQTANFNSAVKFNKTAAFTGISSQNNFSNATFEGTASFKGPLNFTGADATIFKSPSVFYEEAVFKGTATFEKTAEFHGQAMFNSTAKFNAATDFYDRTSFMYVEIGPSGTLRTRGENNSISDLKIDGNGQLIYDKSFVSSPKMLSSAGTLSNNSAGGSALTLKFDSAKLTINGPGTLGLNNTHIDLTGNNSFVLSGSVSIIFSGAGSLSSSNYTLGSGAGTLFSLNSSTFTAGSIAGANSSSALTFSEDDFLTIKPSKVLTLSKVNADLIEAGSISFGPSGRLLISNGGSITTKFDDVDYIAYGGVIAGSAGQGGSLLVGSLSEAGTDAASIAAGSLGTLSLGNFIAAGGFFAKVVGDANNSGSMAQAVVIDGKDGGSASIGGSILIFSGL